MSEVEKITNCRLCGGGLKPYLDMGLSPLANDLVLEKEQSKGEYPLNVVECDSCGLYQLEHNIDAKILFNENYAYSTPPALDRHFYEFAMSTSRKIGASEGQVVMGIGDNNGTLLNHYKKLGFDVVNIEPSSNIAKESANKGIKTYCNFFGTEFVGQYLGESDKVDICCSSNVFAHSPTVGDMFDGIKMVLKDGGVFIQENAYFLDSLKSNDFFQIYFEHFQYWTIKALFAAAASRGMTLYDVEFNNIQNGSFRAFIINRKDYTVNQSVKDAILAERKYFSLNDSSFHKEKLDELGRVVKNYLEANKDKKIGIFGVTAKLTLMLKYWGISDYFSFAVDESKLKQGKLIPGTNIRIYGKDKISEEKPDILFLGAYNFKEAIISNNKDLNVKWFCPIPKVEEI